MEVFCKSGDEGKLSCPGSSCIVQVCRANRSSASTCRIQDRKRHQQLCALTCLRPPLDSLRLYWIGNLPIAWLLTASCALWATYCRPGAHLPTAFTSPSPVRPRMPQKWKRWTFYWVSIWTTHALSTLPHLIFTTLEAIYYYYFIQ